VTWGQLRKALEGQDAAAGTRFYVYRHTGPITEKSIATATLLGSVGAGSGYNIRGRSVDQLVPLLRKKAMEDMALAKSLARSGALGKYTPKSPEMDQVVVERFAIEDGNPLPAGTGLYVHHPATAGKAYYAVCAESDGVRGAPVPAVAPVDETVGVGVPVLQNEVSVSVFFDYPGKRYRYVQWCAPPLAHLPNQYYNWGVFVPRDYAAADAPRRMQVFFHGRNQRYLKPPWPHRQDTLLVAPHDAPFASFGYGYSDALGTDKPPEKGVVCEFFGRRVDAFLEWAATQWQAHPGMISVGGRGLWGGTAALQYGLRRPGRIAFVSAESGPDPDPKQTPQEYRKYPWQKNSRLQATGRKSFEAVWGIPEQNLKAETGRSIWDEVDLVALVKRTAEPLPFLNLGSGSMSVTWKQQTELMLAYRDSRNPFMAEFYWGGSSAKILPKEGWAPQADRPTLAVWPLSYSPNSKFFETNFMPGKRGYGGGSRLNVAPRWDADNAVDTPERFEMTIWSDLKITYAHTPTCTTTVRNTNKFKPPPGTELNWSIVDAKGRKSEGGAITVGRNGEATIEKLTFPKKPVKLVIERKKE
jgi:hypothetical protein